MFDLFRSQQKAVRILLGVLLAMVALSMLVYLIPGAGSSMGMGSKDDQIIAEIGNQVLTVRDVDNQIQSQLRRHEIEPRLAQIMIPQRVEEMTAEWASAYEAQQLGFQVTDRDLAEAIRSISPQIAALTPQQYRDFVEQQMGETVAEFEGNLRLGLYGSALETIAMQGVLATPADVEAEFHKRNDKIKLEYIAFDTTKIAAGLKPSPAELKAYYDKNKGFFNSPESRNVQMIVADPDKLAQGMQVSDADVRAYYTSHKDQFRVQERVKARHILVMTQGKPADEVTKLKAKAEDLLKQVKAGGDFAKLAEKNSDDPGSAKNGGDLGWVVRGQMVPEFEKATFELQPKQISGLVTTNYGFHIIQVLEKEPAHLRTLDEVKGDIIKALQNQSMSEQMQALADKAHADLAKAPQNAAQIAKKYNLAYTEFKYKPGDNIPELGPDKNAPGVFMQMKKGDVSDVNQSDTKLWMATVTAILPPHPADFSEVEAQIRNIYPQQRANEIANEQSAKATELMKANPGDLKAIAKALKLEVKTTDYFSRNGAVEGVGAGQAFNDLFDKPVGTTMGPIRAGGDQVIAKLIDKSAADMSKLPAERDTIVTAIKSKKAQERQALLRDSILNGLMQKGKVKIHKATVDRLVARYRARS
jgi:peptidyl-prolyl cis-trans isomerase D